MQPPGGRTVTALIRSSDGWPVREAILTVTDMTGQQVTRCTIDPEGLVVTGSLPAGSYTSIIMAPGYLPVARATVITESGPADLGVLALDRLGQARLPDPGTWTIDPAHSSVNVTARHLGIAHVRGRFNQFAGEIEIADPPERSLVRARLQADSIDTGTKMRDDHLRSADFLDADTHPFIDYRGTGAEPAGADRWTVHGELTLRGATRPVPLDVTCLGSGPDPWGGQRAAFRAAAELRRDDFAISWNQAILPGLTTVGGVLHVQLDIEAVQGSLPEM